MRLFRGSLVVSLLSLVSFSSFADVVSQDPAQCSKGADSCVIGALAQYAGSGKKVLSYLEARTQMFQFVDAIVGADGQKTVESVYSSDVYPIGNQIPDETQVNTEHTWPQSNLKTHPQTFKEARTDLFHLFPTSSHWNSLRGNLPFGDIEGEPQGERVSECNGQEFEPPEFHKGEVARAMFYMAIEYNMDIDAAQESTLRKWAKEFPVTAKETERAKRVFEVQGNHNPFIDHPEWIDLVTDF